MGIELPGSIQDVLNSTNPQFAGAGAQPQIPGTGMPSAPQTGNPQDVNAPDTEQNDAPQHPVDKLASVFMDHLIAKDKAAQKPAGSFGDKLQGAMSHLDSSFGDSAHATDNLRPGQGAMTGVANTMNARSARLAQEKKDSILNSKNAIEAAMLNQRMKFDTEEHQDKSYAKNAAHVKQLETEEGFNVRNGVTEPEMLNERKNFKVGEDGKHWDDLYDHIQTGTTEVNGRRVPTYSVITRTNEPVTLSAADRAAIKDGGGPDFPEGQKMAYGARRSMMISSAGAVMVRNILEKANDEALTDDQKRIVNSAAKNPEVQHAITDPNFPDDPYMGLSHGLGVATDTLKHNQGLLDMAQKNGDPAAIKEAQQKVDQAQKAHDDIQATMLHGVDRDKYEARHDQRVKEADEKVKEENISRKEAETERHNLADEKNKADEIKAKKAAEEGDIGPAAEMLRKGRQDPSQLSKRAKTYQATLNEADRQEMEETGQHFNIAQAQTDYKYANQKTTKDTLNLINGMTEPGGAIEIASKASLNLPQMNERIANKVFNITKTEFGDNSLTDFHTAMLGLADEYSKVMGGGTASDTGRQQALDLLKDAYSKKQMSGAIAIMQRDIAARKRSIIGKNRYLINEYGDPNEGQQPAAQQQTSAPPKGAGHEGKAADGTQVWQMPDGTIQDASGGKYNMATGKKL